MPPFSQEYDDKYASATNGGSDPFSGMEERFMGQSRTAALRPRTPSE